MPGWMPGYAPQASPQGEALLQLGAGADGLFYATLEGARDGGGAALAGHEDDYLRDRRPELYVRAEAGAPARWERERRALRGLAAALALACAGLVVARRR